jgi:hypothetical protein
LALVGTGGALFVHQGVGRVLEGVVLRGYGGDANPFFVAEAEHRRLPGASACFAVIFSSSQSGRIAVMVGHDQARLLVPIDTAVLVTVMPAFLGGQPFNERQIAFPVLNAVFPFLGTSFEIKHRIHYAPRFQQRAHDGVCGLSLKDAAVVHQP